MWNMKKRKIYKYKIKDLTLFGYHGIEPKEIKNGQLFTISLKYFKKIENNLICTDRIDQVINYNDIITKVGEVFNAKRYSLLETLVNDIHDNVISSFDIYKLQVKVIKSNPPVSYKVNSISIESNNE